MGSWARGSSRVVPRSSGNCGGPSWVGKAPIPSHSWMNLQMRYELDRQLETHGADLDKIISLVA